MTDPCKNVAAYPLLLSVLSALSVGCGFDSTTASPEFESEDVGEVELALTRVPSDAACLRLTADLAGRKVIQDRGLSAGAGFFKVAIGGLPVGKVTLYADVYSVGCSSINNGTSATWVSDPTSVTLDAKVPTTTTLTLRRPATLNLNVDFQCPGIINDAWTSAISSSSTPWKQSWGDPRVDTSTKELVLTRDDVVSRTPRYAGGYYYKFNIWFGANLVVHPNFGGITGDGARRHPALRFSGGLIDVGGLSYAQTSFGTFGSFTGQKLSGNSATAVIYVKSGSKEIAMKAMQGPLPNGNFVIYRSGFSNLGATDVSVLDMVGSNNVGAADGLAKLSTFQGCEALTDAEVQGAYDSEI
jgi:hypothetical protein